MNKTKCILFTKTKLNIVNLVVDAQTIEHVKCFKFLGFWIDSTLSFEHHAHFLYEKLLKSSYIICKLLTFVPITCQRTLYFAHYFSKMSYGINIWFPLLKEPNRTKLKLLQKKIIRAVSCSRFNSHCMSIFKRYNILSIDDMVYLENVKLTFRVYNKLSPVPLNNLFKKLEHRYDTRDKFAIPLFQHRICCISFLSRAVIDWNNIKSNIKFLPHVKLFSKKVKREIIEKY